MNWEHFLQRMRWMFYTEFAMVFASILVIITYILKRKRAKSTIFLAVISAASLLQTVIIAYNELMFQKSIFGSNLTQNSLYPYLTIELTCCLLFVKMHIQSLKAKKLIVLTILLFALYTLIFWMLQPSSQNFYLNLPEIEGFLIILFCLYYFYETFTQRPDRNLLKDPSFWAISGMLFTFSVITPIFSLATYFASNSRSLFRILYRVNDISYCLLFITFIIAIWNDKRSLTKQNSI